MGAYRKKEGERTEAKGRQIPKFCRPFLGPEIERGSRLRQALEVAAHRVDAALTVPFASTLPVRRVRHLHLEFTANVPIVRGGSPMRRSG